VYVFRLLNKVKQNYNTTKRKVFAMVFALHEFRDYLLGNKFIFYVDHMALVYLVNKPQVSERIGKWLLLFIKYDFKVMYKLAKIHEVANALLRPPNITKPTCVHDLTTYVSLFYIEPKWLNDVKEILKIGQIEGTLSV
jgi:hypothetical protein